MAFPPAFYALVDTRKILRYNTINVNMTLNNII